ncbi:MAG: ABC transporter ATP-binding protein [Lachnospiraceae bacterium]|nr:ABC transporter ATP-binding protein [Lachnospiraceae bacterium]
MLKINDVRKQYQDFSLRCSMEVRPGCITGLVGRNGAGKSTALKAALGLIHIDGGSVEMFGKDIHALNEQDKQKLGVVMSDSGFSTYLSVRDINRILKYMYSDYDHEQFMQWCEHFELPLDKQIKEFSTGMKAKLKVLVALCHNASLLLLDEPTVGLDVVVRDELLDLLRSYMEQDENRAIVISSHISSDLETLCDDFYMIHDGEIVLHEETDVLLGEYALLKVNEAEYETLDPQYILKARKESYGYSCLTNQRQYYMENYPNLVMEKGNIDDLVLMMKGGAE